MTTVSSAAGGALSRRTFIVGSGAVLSASALPSEAMASTPQPDPALVAIDRCRERQAHVDATPGEHPAFDALVEEWVFERDCLAAITPTTAQGALAAAEYVLESEQHMVSYDEPPAVTLRSVVVFLRNIAMENTNG
jgi:hypothetical protein